MDERLFTFNTSVMTRIKVCGMRETDNIAALADLQPDYMGIIFYKKSARHAEGIADPAYIRTLNRIKITGVFVNAELAYVEQKIAAFSLDAIQLHGQESPQYCRSFARKGLEIIKVFSIEDGFDFEQLKPYEGLVDFFLFDTKGKQAGGNGIVFNWKILEEYPGQTPFFLSGGIKLEDKERLQNLHFPHLYGIDINSKFEIKPAYKDIEKVRSIVEFFKK